MATRQYFKWSVTLLGKTYDSNSGVLQDVKVKQGAKKRYSTVTIQLTPYGQQVVDAIIAKSKKEKGIKLPPGLIDTDSENAKAVAITGANSGSGVPGLEMVPGLGDLARVAAFLDLTAYCEGSFKDGKRDYGLIVGGGRVTDFREHPGIINPVLYRQTGLNSDAAGVSQFISTTWKKSQPQDNPGVIDRMESAGIKIRGKGFSPEAQNAATAYHMRELSTTGWNAIQNGSVVAAMQAYANTWESFLRIFRGDYDISVSQAVDFYNLRLKIYKSKAAETSSKNLSPAAPAAEVQKSQEQLAKEWNPDEVLGTCNVKAYLETMAAIAFDTAKLGAAGAQLNITGNSITDKSKPVGRYQIPSQLWEKYYNNDGFDLKGQNRVFLKIIKGLGAYDKLSSGAIDSVNRDLYQYFPQIPRADNPRFNVLLADFAKRRDDCTKNQTPVKGSDTKPAAIVETGEPILVEVESAAKKYSFNFSFVDLSGSTITGRSVDSTLGMTQRSERFKDVNEVELAAILLKRNGFNLKLYDSTSLDFLESKNFALTKQTDKDTLERIYRQVGVSFNPISLQDFEASKDGTLPVKRLVITDFFDSNFSVAAVAPGGSDPVDYPVSLTVLTTDSILGLAPRQTVSLLSPYNLVPDALKFDEWVVDNIDHNMADGKSSMVLTKFIRNEEEKAQTKAGESATGPVSSDGKWSTPYPAGQYVVTSEFNPARVNPVSGIVRPHTGIDLAFTGGGVAYIKATRDGRVESAGPLGGYGNAVVIEHDEGFKTLHGHMSEVQVKGGQVVKRGQNLGIEGATGNVTGPHDHYEIYKDGIAVNPRIYHKDI